MLLTTTDASGQTTTYTYYPYGEIKTVTNAKNETTTFAYTGSHLTSIVQPQGATTTLTYDGFGRVATITDVNGYTLNYNYDNLNRLTKTTYPDGTYVQNVYTNLDLTQTRDRLGRWTRYVYNPLEQVIAVFDSADRVTNYTRCICGELTGLTDPLLHTTSWTQDIEGRTILKTFPDKSQTSYAYEISTSRLKSMTDAKEQITTYAYNADDRLARSTYTNTGVATPTVSYIYDPVYPRLTSMQDGTGTTSYTYNPITATPTLGANRLASETGPLGSTATISYSYDPLGRVTATAIGSATSSVTYDSLARVTNATNPLGSFSYGYVGTTPRLASQSYPNGQSTSYSYLAAQQDFRLSEIKNLTPTNAILSKNDYSYNAMGNISSWQEQTDNNTSTIWNYKYDGADQLLSATDTNTSTSAVLGQYFYGYDQSGNRTSEQIGLGVTQANFNSLNQISSRQGGGSLQITGSLNKPGTATVAGSPATIDANNNFQGSTSVNTGTNTFSVVASNLNGNSVTNRYQVVVPPNPAVFPTYDLNGNLTNSGAGQTYAWDAKDELTQITYTGGATTSFTYDGMRRRVAIVEKNSFGTVTSTKQFAWCANQISEERDVNGNVTKRFYPQGEQIGGNSYFYTKDRLGSTHELTNSSGTIVSRYDYDPYGRVTLVQGDNFSDFQYSGYYIHQTSGLNLTKYRAYDPNTAKWLSRDPLAAKGGDNLYTYVNNNSVNYVDLLGLCKNCDSLAESAQQAANAIPALQASVTAAQNNVASAYINLAAALGALAIARYESIILIATGDPILAFLGVAVALAFVFAAEYSVQIAEDAEQAAENALSAGEQQLADANNALLKCLSTPPDPPPDLKPLRLD